MQVPYDAQGLVFMIYDGAVIPVLPKNADATGAFVAPAREPLLHALHVFAQRKHNFHMPLPPLLDEMLRAVALTEFEVFANLPNLLRPQGRRQTAQPLVERRPACCCLIRFTRFVNLPRRSLRHAQEDVK